jgi:hypothetical protein
VKVEQDLLLYAPIIAFGKYFKWRALDQGMRLAIHVKVEFFKDSPCDRKAWSGSFPVLKIFVSHSSSVTDIKSYENKPSFLSTGAARNRLHCGEHGDA